MTNFGKWALGLEKEDMIQALGLCFTISTLALAADLAHGGALQFSVAGTSLMALIPSLLGMFAGQWVRLRIRVETFRLCFFAGLLALGTHLAIRAAI